MSTTQEQIALLNAEKDENIAAIDKLITSKNGLQQAISDSYTSIDNMTTDIAGFDASIEVLENNNLIIDDIIIKLLEE